VEAVAAMWHEDQIDVPARSGTGVTGGLFIISMVGVSFYAGFNPGFFLTTLGAVLGGVSLLSPVLFLLSMRAEELNWKVSLTILAILLAAILMLVFVPSWYLFTYLPAANSPLTPLVP